MLHIIVRQIIFKWKNKGVPSEYDCQIAWTRISRGTPAVWLGQANSNLQNASLEKGLGSFHLPSVCSSVLVAYPAHQFKWPS